MEKQRCYGCMKLKNSDPVCEHCGYDNTTPNAAHQLRAGTVLHEQYMVGKVLGQGGFGITYLGWDMYLDIPVAIKEYFPSGMVMRETSISLEVSDVSGGDGARFRNNRERFMREAKMLARFSQVNEIVQIKNFFLANNTAYIVMEYVEGITLKQYVRQQGGKLTAEETFELLKPTIRALGKVHKAGIVHRDISPDNIMLLPGGGSKLLDFGAVRDVGAASVDKELTKSTEAILKQGYAPIEQYQKKGALGPWTDVYALCATIYYCITGEVPPDSPARVLDYEELDISKVKGLTDAQRAALEHGLEIRAEKRTGSMEQLYDELFPKPAPAVREMPKEEPPKEEPPKAVHPSAPEPREKTAVHTGETQKTAVAQRTETAKKAPAAPRPENKKTPTRNRGKRKSGWLPLALLGGLILVVLVIVLLGRMGGVEKSDPAASTSAPAQAVEEGRCGTDMTWTLYEDGRLVLSGYGEMFNYCAEWHGDNLCLTHQSQRPWENYLEQIRTVVIGKNITSVGDAAFLDCSNLETVEFQSETLRSIGMGAFMNTALKQVDLPESLTSIASSAFENTQLRKVELPDSVTDVGNGAFANCKNLTSVTIGPNTRLNYDIWREKPTFCREDGSTDQITLQGPGGGIAEDYANLFGHPFKASGETEFEGQGDFSAYPGNVDGRWYFDRQTHFLKIEGEMPTDMVGMWEINMNQVEPDRQSVPEQPWKDFREEIYVVSIAEGVTRICDNAFENCWNLTDIYLPSTLKSIGFQSFLSTNVDEIIIPDSVTEISNHAFNYCRNLRMVKLPYGLEELRYCVFNMTQLEKVYAGNRTRFETGMDRDVVITPFNSNPPEVAPSGDDETALPKNLTIYTPQGSSGNLQSPAKEFAEKFGLAYEEGIFQHENAEVFGDMAFGASNVFWALEDGTLTLVGSGETPFYRSDNNQDRNAWGKVQPGAVTLKEEAPWYPFRNEIHTVIIEPGITTLNRGVLCDMPNLEWVEFGTVERLYTNAIVNCGVNHLILPDTLHTISDSAIKECRDLRTLEIHNGDIIERNAFPGSTGLSSIYFYGGGEHIRGDLFGSDHPDVTFQVKPYSGALQYAIDNDYYYAIHKNWD